MEASVEKVAPPVAQSRIEYVDGLRGVAVFAVVLFHAAIWASLPRDEPLFRILSVGRAGVDVFLAVSGFCLFYPLVKRDGPVGRLRVREFLVRRIRRIVPPYYAALAIVTFVSWLTYTMLGDRSRALQKIFPVDPVVLGIDTITHLTMLHGLDNRTAHSFDGAFWSISLEWQFYILFLPLALLSQRSVVLAVLIPLIVTILYRGTLFYFAPDYLATYVGNELSLGRWIEFSAGMAAACTLSRRWGSRLGMSTHTSLLLVALCSAVVYEYISRGTGAFLPIIWALVGYELIVVAEGSSGLQRCLEAKPMLFLGRISYSVYLVHGSAMMLLATGFNLTSMSSATKQLAVLLLSPLCALCGGLVFYLTVERHFLPDSLRRRQVR